MSLKPHEVNELNNFMGGWYLDDTEICDALIQYYKDSPGKYPGIMGVEGKGGMGVNKAGKDSTDVNLNWSSEITRRYIGVLNRVAKEYVSKYMWSAKLVPWSVIEPMAVQHYKPGEGYKAWHFERDNSQDFVARRHLAFMTYLNDVDEGGGTEFLYQKLTIKAEKGLTLIWPAEWMFTHRGVVSNTREKYIITGWYSTYTREQFEEIQKRVGKIKKAG